MSQSPVRRRMRAPEPPPADVDADSDIARRYSEASALLEIARSLLGTSRPSEILGRLLHSTLGLTGASHAVGYVYSPAQSKLRAAVAFGLTPPSKSEVFSVSPASHRILTAPPDGGVLLVRASCVTGIDPLPDGPLRRWAESLEAAFVVPLVLRSNLLAAAVVGPRIGGEPYAADTLDLLVRAARMAAQAVEAGAEFAELTAEQRYPTLPDLELQAPSQVSRRLREIRAAHPIARQILGDSAAMLQLLEEAASVAPTRCPVLIQGETGSGKELLARAVHEMSPRREGPFEVVDCGSIPRDLIESELFGHERGAFTGAVKDRRGVFEMAHHGTVFLDELGELPLPAQTRLLRVLQEGCFRRVGGEETVHVDVRVVAATNRDLWEEVEAGRFRSDLFYRVSVLTLRIPPLRERKGDIPVLARRFAQAAAEEMGTPVLRIDAALEARLLDHDYPGNIRELQNLVTALAVGRPIGGNSSDLGRILRRPATAGPTAAPPKRGEQSMGHWVLTHLRMHGFNVASAGRTLKVAQAEEGTNDAPVADRTTLTYYFQGECLRAFCDADFDVERAAKSLAGGPHLVGVVGRRLRSILKMLAAAAQADGGIARARSAAERRLPKLPATYQDYLDRALRSYIERQWRLAG